MNIHIVEHPLIQHKLTLLRKKSCTSPKFRELSKELSTLLAYEVTKDFETEQIKIETWCGEHSGKQIKGKKVTLLPILRAGIGMLDGCLSLLPNAKISMVGLYRDKKTLDPTLYFEKLADNIKERTTLILDPMLATGGSMIATIDILKKKKCEDIRAIVFVASPEGVNKINKAHPDVKIYTAALDSHLNDDAYIIPGLGDAGDNIFGTR